MNKETIDYALTKLNEAFQAIKPDAIELGSEYVNYMVLKAVLGAVFPFIIGVILVVVSLLMLSRYQKIIAHNSEYYKKLYDNDSEVVAGAISGICGVIGILLSAVGIINSFTAVLALNYPLMYTIEQLTK